MNKNIYNELKCKPIPTGDFVQAWYCQTWNQQDFDNHLDKLKSVGIEYVIIQSSYEVNEKGELIIQIFEDETHPDNKSLMYLLSAAEARDMKVFIGSNFDPSWWNDPFVNDQWIKDVNDINKANMQRCFDLYAAKYPKAFYGWYLSWEMHNDTDNYGKYTDMMNRYIKDMSEIDIKMPILFSPFFNRLSSCTPYETQKKYEEILPKMNFRKGDIFCPQDSYGATGWPISVIEQFVKGTYEAAKTNNNLLFWVNAESFNQDATAASVEKFSESLESAARYADNIISFSITHYQICEDVKPADSFIYYKQFVDDVNLAWDKSHK